MTIMLLFCKINGMIRGQDKAKYDTLLTKGKIRRIIDTWDDKNHQT